MESNQMKMREALEKIARYAEDMCSMNDPYCADWRICADIARKALAVPLRNCDMGTAMEQSNRFMDFCRPGNRPSNCEECKVYPNRMNKFWCQLEWAQMPYEEGGGKQ